MRSKYTHAYTQYIHLQYLLYTHTVQINGIHTPTGYAHNAVQNINTHHPLQKLSTSEAGKESTETDMYVNTIVS